MFINLKKKSKPYLDLCLDRLEKRLKIGQTTPHLPSRSENKNQARHECNLHQFAFGGEQITADTFLAGKQPMLNPQVPASPEEGTPIHYLYEYVPPNGVVILKLLI